MWAHPGFFPIGFFFVLLIFGFIIFRMIWWNGPCGWRGREMEPEIDPIETLKQRLAKGEISEEDYLHLKEIISK